MSDPVSPCTCWSTSLYSDFTRCIRLTSWFPCLNPRINFSKIWFLLLLTTVWALATLTAPRHFHQRAMKHTEVFKHLCVCVCMYSMTYISLTAYIFLKNHEFFTDTFDCSAIIQVLFYYFLIPFLDILWETQFSLSVIYSFLCLFSLYI